MSIFKTTGNFKEDIKSYFEIHGKLDVYEHTLDVIHELDNIRQQFGQVHQCSEIACYCHDLGRVIDKDDIIPFCIESNIHITDEEKIFPSILHQKISKFIAKEVFEVQDKDVLDAINYHTTSRKQPSKIEMEVFLADKLSWKEEGHEPLTKGIREALKVSYEKAMLYYLMNLESNKENVTLGGF